MKVSLKLKDDPVTEMKRVPYRISTRNEGDMFDVFSYSDELEPVSHRDMIGTGLIANVK